MSLTHFYEPLFGAPNRASMLMQKLDSGSHSVRMGREGGGFWVVKTAPRRKPLLLFLRSRRRPLQRTMFCINLFTPELWEKRATASKKRLIPWDNVSSMSSKCPIHLTSHIGVPTHHSGHILLIVFLIKEEKRDYSFYSSFLLVFLGHSFCYIFHFHQPRCTLSPLVAPPSVVFALRQVLSTVTAVSAMAPLMPGARAGKHLVSQRVLYVSGRRVASLSVRPSRRGRRKVGRPT